MANEWNNIAGVQLTPLTLKLHPTWRIQIDAFAKHASHSLKCIELHWSNFFEKKTNLKGGLRWNLCFFTGGAGSRRLFVLSCEMYL